VSSAVFVDTVKSVSIEILPVDNLDSIIDAIDGEFLGTQPDDFAIFLMACVDHGVLLVPISDPKHVQRRELS
jgi:hypothetical protein